MRSASAPRYASTPLGTAQAVLLLRWVLIIASSYLVVFSRSIDQRPASGALFVAAYFASNIVLTELLARLRWHSALGIGVAVFDTVMISIGLALTRGANSDFYVVYFLVVFLSALTDRLPLVVGAAALISAAHLYTEARLVGLEHLLNAAYFLRVPFLFVVAMFFGHLVQDARNREREAENARARQRRMEILSGLSHDLKNPLGVVQSLTIMLLEGEAGPLADQQADLVRRIHASTRRVMTLALNLIDAERIEAGQLVLHRAPVALADLVEDGLLQARSACDVKGVALRCEVESDLPVVHIDAVQMGRVIANLVGNAIKFTPRGGTVTLSLRRGAGGVVLSVSDDGPGIAPDEVPLVFDKYRSLAASRGGEGSGLGLFIVKRIVEAHGGTVTVDSEVGAGTTATVQLPIAPGDPMHPRSAPSLPSGWRSWWPLVPRARRTSLA